jgi:ferredoxin-NADP reductase
MIADDTEARFAEPLADWLATDLPDWNPDIDDVLVCRQVRDETHDVRTFVFSGRQPCLFRFKPGQFLTFDLPIGETGLHRCYTISSAPTRPHLVSITVKRTPGGIVTNWLHDQMTPGREIRAVGPMGEFSTLNHPAAKYLFLSGGSGITPLMSMARAYYDLAQPRDILFVHSARSPADIIFRDELALIARGLPGFRLAHLCESDAGDASWSGYRGRLSPPLLRLIAPDFAEREIFTCGPAPYMAAVRDMLREAGFDMARYHEESFCFEDRVPIPAEAATEIEAVTAPAVTRFRVEFTKSRRVIECDETVNILDAARAAGMRLPSSCTRGLCGTCKSRMVSGKVDMKHAGGIRQREIDQGQILICCSRPLSDLVIER